MNFTEVLITIFTIIDAMVALLLIAVVLVQQSKDGGFGGAPFGGAGDSVFGAHAADHLTKITVGLAAIFLCLTLTLAIITGRRPDDDGNLPENKDGETEMKELVNEKKDDVAKEDQEIMNELGLEKSDTPNTIVIPKTGDKPVKVKLPTPEKVKKLIDKKKSETSKPEAPKTPAVPKKPTVPEPAK